jgi:hypothetical protein
MNTNSLLRQHAERCKEGDLARDQPLYSGFTIDELMEECRWDGGSWGYFPMFCGPDFEEVAAAYREIRASVGGSERDLVPLREEFMLMACRAVIRIERSGVFGLFRQTPDFRVLCVYIQETVEEGELRLQRVRSSYRPQ